MTTEQLIEVLSSVDTRLLTEQSVEQTTGALLELNQQQMEEGIASDGDKIHWQKDGHYPYTKKYAGYKAKLGLQTEVVDLKLTGTFYKEGRVKVDGDNVDFYNDGGYDEHYLETNYGKQIYGLTDENKQAYREGPFAETFREKFTDETGLHFKR
jgi:hypothetical protein